MEFTMRVIKFFEEWQLVVNKGILAPQTSACMHCMQAGIGGYLSVILYTISRL